MSFSIQEVLHGFPAPSFRKFQKETIIKIAEAFNSGIKCILLDAPTGSGKSYVNMTFCKLRKSFYTTPQLSLIDQILADPLLRGTIVEIKGRQNYICVYDPAATCDVGVCYRTKDFSCSKSEVCPYWVQKLKALSSRTALMSFAYFFLEGKVTETPYSFGNRPLLVLDESHNIDREIINHVNLTISPWSVPWRIYEGIQGLIKKEYTSVMEVLTFMKIIRDLLKKESFIYEQRTLDGSSMTIGDLKEKNRADDFVSKVDTFEESLDSTEWIWQTSWTNYHGKPCPTLIVQPLYARFFAADMLWSRADTFIVSSATILDPQRFSEEAGLDRVLSSSKIMHVKVPSTFPPENRPIIDISVGKMTRSEKDTNFKKAVEMLEAVIVHELGKNIAVHTPSYEDSKKIYETIKPELRPLLVAHNSSDRQEQLEFWKSSKGRVFIAVAFREGQDWKGEICEAQALFRVPFPDVSDRRVAARLARKQWVWYYQMALKEVIQAYGRAVRSPEEKKNFYVVDSSFWSLLRKTRRVLPKWFVEALPLEWEKK